MNATNAAVMKPKRRPLDKDDKLRMNLPRRFWDVTFKEITDYTGYSSSGVPSLKDVIGNYLRQFDDMIERGAGLLLWGQNGIGKTCAAAVLAMEARRRGRTTLFLTASEYLEAIHEKHMFDENISVVERAKKVDILVIDDFGKEYEDSKAWSERQFEELIRNRSAQLRVTVVTMNTSLERFSERSAPGMVQIMKGCLASVNVSGPDRREEVRQELDHLIVQKATEPWP